jgi:serpin B
LLARYAETSEDYELSIVDRLFGDRRVPFEAAFLADAERTFRAPLEKMDFVGAPEPARAHINAWVAEQTHERIEDLMPPGAVTAATKLVLVNAIYFKAAWMEPFPSYGTHEGSFYGPRGEVTAKLMHRTAFMRWGSSPDGKVDLVELPYGDDGRFAMTIALPRARDGLAALERGLDAATWSTWVEGMSDERVSVTLPKFRIEMPEPLRLAKILQSLGIERAFDHTRADFTKMAPAAEQLEISEGFHKAFIEVDEKGTEAAAATALGMRAGSAMPTDPPKQFRCDHPFAFAIRDTGTGAILFFGHVADPTV